MGKFQALPWEPEDQPGLGSPPARGCCHRLPAGCGGRGQRACTHTRGRLSHP